MNIMPIVRHTLSALIICIGSVQMTFAQVIIGSLPPGTSIINDYVDLRIADHIRDTVSYIDIDGDGTQDIKIKLHHGAPPVDDPHQVTFFILNNSFSFCTYDAINRFMYLYELGDTICSTGQEWGDESFYIVGCNGGFFCNNVFYINDKYITYRKIATGEIGWMKLSASLWSGVTPDSITFTISELLALYEGTGINTVTHSFDFEVIPNPTTDGQCFIQSNENIIAIDLFNSQGQYLKTYPGSGYVFALPDVQGLYFVRVKNDKHQFSIRKIIRL